MKIILISPAHKSVRSTSTFFPMPSMALALLAKITPPEIEVSIVDEIIKPFNFDVKVDLVGITVSSKTAVRSYEIADELRKRGVSVVMGGVHPTVVPQEAIEHADAVVIGEAEGVWNKLLDDFDMGSLQKFYKNYSYPDIQNYPIPNRDLLQKNKYITTNFVQTSRGCPHNCNFCSVPIMFGTKIRLRSVDNVIKEIKTLSGKDIIFLDDNIAEKKSFAKELFTKLIPLKKKWLGQSSVTIVNDKEMLKLLYKSGCRGLLVGFESISGAELKEAGKKQNIKNDYFETIKILHDNGIVILGSFILGLDTQDKFYFEKLLEFLYKSKIDIAEFCILMPYPGTRLYQRLKQENRLIDDKWWFKFEANDVVFKPKLMTREQLYQGWIWTIKEFYKMRPMLQRCLYGIGKLPPVGNMIAWKINQGLHKHAYALHEKIKNPLV